MKKGNVFWGIALLLTAVLVLLNELNVGFTLPIAGIPIVSLILCVVCLAWTVSCIAERNTFAVMTLSFAFIAIKGWLSDEFFNGDSIISTWIVILVAVMMWIALDNIFPKSHKKHKQKKHHDNNDSNEKSDTNGTFSFQAGQKYVDCVNFVRESVKTKFGSVEIRFSNTECYVGNGVLDLDNHMGATEVFIPSDWNPVINVANSMGSVEWNGVNVPNGKTIYIEGKNRMGIIEITRL